MKVLVWLLRAVIFILLFGLAIKNSGTVELRFYLNQIWVAPLSLVLLVVFVAGVVVGLMAALVPWARQRRQLAELHARLPGSGEDSVRHGT